MRGHKCGATCVYQVPLEDGAIDEALRPANARGIRKDEENIRIFYMSK